LYKGLYALSLFGVGEAIASPSMGAFIDATNTKKACYVNIINLIITTGVTLLTL